MKHAAWLFLSSAYAMSASSCDGCYQAWVGGAGGAGGDSAAGTGGQTGSVSSSGPGSTGAGAGLPAHMGGANRPPLARSESFVTENGEVMLFNLIANDTDPDGDLVMRINFTQPSHGMIIDLSGELYYAVAPGFVGEDMLTYEIQDEYGGTDTADVYIYTPAKTYYVSPTGNDTNIGTSPSGPWRTLTRVQTLFCGGAVAPGDAILLQRSGVWRESLTTCNRSGEDARPIVIGAYGDNVPGGFIAPTPVITGSDEITGWTQDTGGVWKASVTGPVADLYWNGARQTPARFPDTTWMLNKPATPGLPAQINADGLTGAAGAYAGATLRMRTVNWAYESRGVTASSPGSITLDSAPTHDVSDGAWGFFLDGKRAFLDAPGEWFHDTGTGTLYFYPPGGAAPQDGLVEAVVRDRVLEISNTANVGAYVVADTLALRHAAEAALVVSYLNHHATVRHAEITDSYWGMRVFADNVAVVGTQFARTRGNALWLEGANNRVERSEFHDIAVIPGYGEPTWGYFGVQVNGGGSVARQNILDGIGYTGITAAGNNVLIEENVVRRSNAILNDGGSIAFDNCDGLTVRRNIVTEPVGSLEGVSPDAGPSKSPYRPILFGIYFGNTSITNTTVEGNIATQHTGGITVDHTMASAAAVVRDNLLFDNTDQQVMFSDQSVGSCLQSYDETFTGNTLMSGDPSQKLMFHQNVTCATPVDWGTFDNNRYYAPYGDDILYRDQLMNAQYTGSYTLAEWQADSGDDASSQTLAAGLQLGPNVKPRLEYNTGRTVRIAAPPGAWRWPDGTDATMPIDIPAFSAVLLLPK
jgi:hypothetical protein